MNKIYAWLPHKSQGGQGMDVGHAAMDIAFGQGQGKAVYVSWWPTEGASLANGFKRLTAGVNTYVQDVTSEGGNPDDTVLVDCLDEDRMRTRWSDIQGKGGYALAWKNCAHTVADVLLAGGACLSFECLDYAKEHALWTPAEVVTFARLINANDSAIKRGRAGGFKPAPLFV